MYRKSDRLEVDYLYDIVNAIEDADSFVYDINFEIFRNDDKTVFAVVRALEILGEAARAVSDTTKESNEDIPWQIMMDMRNKLIHEYFGVNRETIWKTVKEDLPSVRDKVEKLIDKLEAKI